MMHSIAPNPPSLQTGPTISAAVMQGPQQAQACIHATRPHTLREHETPVPSQMGIFFNCGQVCSATSRLLIHRDIEKAFLAKLKLRTESIKIANPLEPDARLGPIVSEIQYNKVIKYIEVGLLISASQMLGCKA